jgi:tRNA-5-methyluridine54 2-sulfurtransferase
MTMPMRCKRCRGKVVIEVRRHNAAFCRDCFFHYVRQQVSRAIAKHRMLAPEDRVLVAVSGGKDSLALWDLLLDLGYQVDGLYLGLGIGAYSDRSKDLCQAFADARGAKLVVHDLAAEQGYTIPEAAGAGRLKRASPGGRSSCAVCGLSKRYVFNRAALEGGYDVVATGHNLDDEAAVLFANTLRWDTASMARQFPVLEATRPGLVKKVKPLYRLAERESAAYCVLKGIDYVVEECPLVGGNTQMRHKETLNQMEEASPGTKHTFLFGYLDRAATLLRAADVAELAECSRCGMVTQAPDDPSEAPVCAFCRTRARLVGEAGAGSPRPAGPAGRRALPVVGGGSAR